MAMLLMLPPLLLGDGHLAPWRFQPLLPTLSREGMGPRVWVQRTVSGSVLWGHLPEVLAFDQRPESTHGNKLVSV